MTFQLKLGGNDVASQYDLGISELRTNWDGPPSTFPTVVVPGREGVYKTSSKRQLAVKPYVIVARFLTDNASDFESKTRALKAYLYGQTVAIIGGNQSTLQLNGDVTDVVHSPDIDAQAGNVEIHAECFPLWIETSTTTVTGSSGSDIACATGDWLSRPIITVTSPSSPLTITPKDFGGSTLPSGAMVLAVGSPTTVVIDCEACTITIDGVRHDEALTSGDFVELDPTIGTSSFTAGHFPTLRLSSGSLSAAYAKRFL